jgi:hypothetical protein
MKIKSHQLPVAPLVLKFCIHQEQTGRKGVRGGEEEGRRGGGVRKKARVVKDSTT